MKNPATTIREFARNLGPVEQAQVVASTAVVVTMSTIILAMVLTGQSPRLMDFISILAVGIIGFTSVYFSLLHSRQLDEQRRQLLALNTIAEAVNREVERSTVLQSALAHVTDILSTPHGWIYMLEGESLALTCSKGSSADFLAVHDRALQVPSLWLNQPRVEREHLQSSSNRIPGPLKELGIQFWASIPLRTVEGPAGILVVAGENFAMFTSKQAEMMEAFGNQISVALNNAVLFERLKASERRYADLFEHAPDLYLTVDRNHRIVSCNATGLAMLGFPREEIIGARVERFFLDRRQDDLARTIEEMFAQDQGFKDIEAQMCRSDGRTLNVILNSSLGRNETDGTVNARVVARDTTDRKLMEEALLHAQKIDSIGNLAGGIAHDFNNILAAILGSASIMRRKLTERSKLGKYVEIIESSAHRGSSLTRQLLTFARKTETLTAPVDLNLLIDETLQLFQRSVNKEIRVETSLTRENATVNGDDGQIQQALLNLFLNARDAMPDGGTMSVSTDVTSADAHTTSQFSSVRPGMFVAVTVADTGTGIPANLRSRIFEPFFTTKDHGTGLGLSVVYGVIQNHGGFITLDSTPGLGSTFTMHLPRSSTLPQARQLRRRTRLPRGTENILMIDDEVSVCEIARDMLSGLGYAVQIVHDGKTGLEYYRDRQANVDCILLDVNMPVMGGKQTFDLLRQENPFVRIILITGYGRDTLETSRFSSEINGFIQKPFQIELLATKLRQVLDEKPVKQEQLP